MGWTGRFLNVQWISVLNGAWSLTSMFSAAAPIPIVPGSSESTKVQLDPKQVKEKVPERKEVHGSWEKFLWWKHD